jgi:ActR/RegA family two-component response regulator
VGHDFFRAGKIALEIRYVDLENEKTCQPRILLVDDDPTVRETLKAVLKMSQFQVSAAGNVAEAIHLIDTQPFDALLSDLHMPGAGDGFTVISAMRHKHPDAITLLFTGYPALKEAMDAILLQADEILVKPMPIPEMIALIRDRLSRRGGRRVSNTERVASILERDSLPTIANWLSAVKTDDELACIPLGDEQRTGHLPQLLRELVDRLRVPRQLGTKQPSEGAVKHGIIRQAQGYSIPMVIEESRILQVSIFNTLQTNLSTVDFSLLLVDVMTIADEVDSQLKQTIISFSEAAEGVAA